MRARDAGRAARRRAGSFAFAAAWSALVLISGAAVSSRLILEPERVRGWIRTVLSAPLNGQLSFSDDVEVNPFRLGVAVRDVLVRGPTGEEVLRVKRAAVLPRLPALLLGRIEASEVVIEGPVLRLARRSDGSFNIAEALKPDFLQGVSADPDRRWPSVRLRGGRIHLLREDREPPDVSPGAGADASPPAETVLTEVSFSAAARGGRLWWKGEARHPLARRLTVAGSLDPKSASVDCDVRAAKVDLSRPLEGLLYTEAVRDLRALDLQGFADLDARIRYDRRSRLLVPVRLSGRFIRCQLAPPRAVFPIRQLGGRFTVRFNERGQTIDLEELEGLYGEGRITGQGTIDVEQGGKVAGMDLAARAQAIPLDHRLRARLDAGLRRLYDDFRPQGSIGVDLRLRARPFPPGLKDLSAVLSLNGVTFAYSGFPYPFHDLTGEAAIEGGRLTLKRPLIAKNGDAVLTVTGQCDVAGLIERAGTGPGPGDLAFEARVENLAVDEALREALPVSARAVWDWFQPAGRAELTVSARPGGDGGLGLAAYVLAQGVRISYARFPYEITDITGRMHFELSRRRFTLADLQGMHGGQLIAGEGVVEWGERPMYRIDLKCGDLRLDDALKAALSPNARRLLDDFNFRGRARTDVTIHSTGDGGAGVKVELDLIEGEVAYVLFPYPLSLAGGHFTASGEQALRFSDVVTRDRAPDGSPARPRVVFNGGIGLEGGERLFDFRFEVKEIDVDDRLRRVLPPELKRFVEGMGLEGTFQAEVTGTFSHPVEGAASAPADPARSDPGPPAPGSRLVYRARRVSARDAAVNFGVQIRRIDAEGEFVGGKDETGHHYFDGSVQVKSAAFNRLQLRDADITFTLGREHPALAGARQGLPPADGEFRPLKLLDRVGPERSRESFQMCVRRSDLYGGNVQGFLSIDVGQARDFAGEFTASGVQVARAAPDVFGVNETGASGEARGDISFRGSTGDPASIRGEGQGFIEKARLVELPLFVGMVSLLFGEASAHQYFNEVAIRFGIRDGKFRASGPDGIVIKSQGMHLKGGGTMNFEGKLDLALSPEFLRMKIPILDQIFSLVKKGLAQVWVTGDVSRPKVSFVTGAGLLQIPIDARPRTGDRPLPRDLREEPPGEHPPEKQPEKKEESRP